MYKTDFAQQLDEGTANVTVEGKIVFSLTPKHVVSEPGAQKVFDFWSQFIAVEDDKGSMGANITFGKEEEKKKNGDVVQVKGTIHKYEATNKKTGKIEQKVVLNNAKIVEPEGQEEELKPQSKEGNVKKNTEELSKTAEDTILFDKESEEKYFRQSAVEIAKDVLVAGYMQNDKLLNYAENIFQYIVNGKNADIKKNEKVKETLKTKQKAEDKEEKTKSIKTNSDLEELFKKGQAVGLPTWVELISFAIEKKIFPDKTGIEVARKKLLANEKDCYDNLLDFIDIKENIDELEKEDYSEEEQNENEEENKEYTDEIPF